MAAAATRNEHCLSRRCERAVALNVSARTAGIASTARSMGLLSTELNTTSASVSAA